MALIMAILPPSGMFSFMAFTKKISLIETFAPTISFESFSIFAIASVAVLDKS